MTLNEYQQVALTTAIIKDNDFQNLSHWVLGITGEAGEIAEKLKKIIRDKDGVLAENDKDELVKEMGDVLWYLAVLADHLGHDFKTVAQRNVEKLKSRKARDVIKGAGDNR